MSDALLDVRGVWAGYGRLDVVRDADLEVRDGELVALLGPNGAGKSSLLHVVAGRVPTRRGSVSLRGHDLVGVDAAERARCGLYLLPEGKAVFPHLTVAENLRVASARPEREMAAILGEALTLFPILAQRREQTAGTLSGGEQRMLALARAFCAEPLLLLLDEPSLGLAPKVVDDVFRVIDVFRQRGVSVLLVEQYAERALAMADRAYVMGGGRIAPVDPAGAARALADHYVGRGR